MCENQRAIQKYYLVKFEKKNIKEKSFIINKYD